MEIFGIMLSVPAAFVASGVYALILNKFVWKRVMLRRTLQVASLIMLSLIVLEVALLASVGATRLARICGPSFYAAHIVLFFAAVPALTNAVMLRGTQGGWLRVLVAACAGAVFALPVALMQYGVSEALYGVD